MRDWFSGSCSTCQTCANDSEISPTHRCPTVTAAQLSPELLQPPAPASQQPQSSNGGLVPPSSNERERCTAALGLAGPPSGGDGKLTKPLGLCQVPRERDQSSQCVLPRNREASGKQNWPRAACLAALLSISTAKSMWLPREGAFWVFPRFLHACSLEVLPSELHRFPPSHAKPALRGGVTACPSTGRELGRRRLGLV